MELAKKRVNHIDWHPWESVAFTAAASNQHQLIWIDARKAIIPADFNSVLSGQELSKAARYHRAEDRHRYMLTRYAIRNLLSLLSGVLPAAIVFNTVSQQKPTFQHYPFSITHSGTHIYIAISKCAVGIDAEQIKNNKDIEDVAAACFTVAEQQWMAAQTAITDAFYTLWTRKEALLKATGEGITDQMKEIEVARPTIIRQNQTWQLQTWQHEDYILSAATTDAAVPYTMWQYKP